MCVETVVPFSQNKGECKSTSKLIKYGGKELPNNMLCKKCFDIELRLQPTVYQTIFVFFTFNVKALFTYALL